jgi:para-aminobenzoate synthetase / 4-amino-4-deoxychorismate lyase
MGTMSVLQRCPGSVVAVSLDVEHGEACLVSLDGIGVVRLDDLVAGTGWQFRRPLALHTAACVDQVVSTLAAAEAAARAGRWVVGFVAYEAAPAFDPAFRCKTPSPDTPLVCFVEFAEREVGPALADVPAGSLLRPAGAIDRLGGGAFYRDGVGAVRDRIALGDVYQVNLTDRLSGHLAADPIELYRSMIHSQRGSYNAFFDLGPLVVVSASPELFFDFDGHTVRSKPMKGTTARRPRADDDAHAADELLASEKDRAENVMIVDLIRNDLSRLACPGGVDVPALFDVERYETVWQLTSTVRARVRPGTSTGDVFGALFPCGSITGAPKISAMGIVDELEPWARGLYCGAIGYMGPGDGVGAVRSQFSVAIRTAVVNAATNEFMYGAGGGITWDSDPDAEDAELESKTAVLRRRRPTFGLIETLRHDANGPQHLDRHLDRLAASADYFGFLFDRAALQRELDALPPAQWPMRLRLTLDRVGAYTVSLVEFAEAPATVRLGVASTRLRSDNPLTCHKTSARSVYEQAKAEHPDVDDVVMVNERDEVVETAIASLLYRRGSRWYSPPLSAGGLNGIGRAVLMESGGVEERSLHLDDLASCDELHVVSSLRGRRPAILVGWP